MNLNKFDLCGCAPIQIININIAINDLNDIVIYNSCNESYNINSLQFAYSVDNICWACYMSYNDFVTNTIELHTDFYVRIKVQGEISKIELNGEQFINYSTQLDSSFNFTYCTRQKCLAASAYLG